MASMRDVVPYNRPNWTMPEPTPATPGTAVVPSSRPNWTTPPMRPQPAVDFDLGPGNPRVPQPGMSAEAQAFRAPPTSTPAAPATPPADRGNLIQRAMRSMRSGASTAADAVGGAAKTGISTGKALGLAALPAAAGAGVGALQRMADANGPAPEPFVPPAAKPGDIPTGGVTAPKAVEQHPLGFGPDNEFTRNLANTFNAVSGLGRGIGAGVGAVSKFMREGSGFAAGAARAESAAQKAIPFVQGAQAGSALAAPEPAAPSMRPGGSLPGTGVTPPPNPAGTIRRVGNSYSADGPIRFGADIDNPRNPGAGVTVLDMSEGRRQDAMELARMRAEAPQGPTMGGFAGGEQVGMARTGGTANFGPSLSVLGPSGTQRPRDIRAANTLAAEREIARMRESGEMARATMRDASDMSRANLSAQVQRENNDATIQATMRGQDIAREGHHLTAAQSQAAARRTQANADRDFQRGVANDDFTQQSTAQSDHNKWVESTFTTKDGDGKVIPDTQKIGDFNNTAQASIGALVAQLRQSGDPSAIAKADKLARRGLAGLDVEDRALLKQLYDRRERHMQTRGASPFAGSGAVSNNLMDYAVTGRTPGLVQNTVQMRGGQSIPENDLRYTTPANTILPDWFKTPTTAYGPTPQEERRMREGSR